jgi:hypothetical protein
LVSLVVLLLVLRELLLVTSYLLLLRQLQAVPVAVGLLPLILPVALLVLRVFLGPLLVVPLVVTPVAVELIFTECPLVGLVAVLQMPELVVTVAEVVLGQAVAVVAQELQAVAAVAVVME